MFEKIVEAIRFGRSPYLFTCVEGEKLGAIAIRDGEQTFGDSELIPSVIDETELPAIRDGILIERITTPPHLILCGAGHVSVTTAEIAKAVGFTVTVIDEREDFANRDRFPTADTICTMPFVQALDRINDPNAYYVIVTRGHRDDRACLERILRKPYVYCGMIGSKSKIHAVYANMLAQGYTEQQLRTVHAPIGLEIGAVTPEEIAVCIVAELIQVKNGSVRGSEWDRALCDGILNATEPYAMVTLISKKGSAPRSTGARMIVRRDATILSSVGGGYGEYEAAQYALEMLKHGPNMKRYTCKMNNTDAANEGMICGGEIDILIQVMEGPSWAKTSN